MKKIALLILFLSIATAQSQTIAINEILSSNSLTNVDDDNTYQDWIEIYNTSDESVNLAGYGLTDDSEAPYKWVFPEIALAPHAHMLVWCSDKNRTDPDFPLHANFKISADGETISITDPDGNTIDSVAAAAIPPDVSYGRIPDGTGPFFFFSNITPGAGNSVVGFTEILQPPVFSNPSGFFAEGFDLELTAASEGATVIYTLDGSEPDANNLAGTTYSYKNQYAGNPGETTGPLLSNTFTTLSYTAPIPIADRSALPNKIASISSTYDFDPAYIPANPIFKGTVVRAKTVKPGAMTSESVTRNYFVTPLANNRFSLPVVALSIDEDQLYDYNEGIYVAGVDFDTWRAANPEATTFLEWVNGIANFHRSGIENERIANMSYFVNGNEVANQKVGIRIHGASSREFRNKSLNIYSRSEYGASMMDYPFFPDNAFNSYKRLVLRNSGNDFTQTMFRDALCQTLMRSLNLVTARYQPSVTFINGEYWGMLNIREKIDDKYFERAFDFPEDSVDILENQYVVEEGDNVHYLETIGYLESHSLADDANYEQALTRIDPENLRDYYIANIFFANNDWLWNNVVYWRKKTESYIPDAPYGHDGRWRWAAHDMDITFGASGYIINTNVLERATLPNEAEPYHDWSTLVIRRFLENDAFKKDFISRFADLLNTNFLTSEIDSKITAMADKIAPEMPEVSARWQAPLMDSFNYHVWFERDFAIQRPAIQRDQIRQRFGINSNIDVTLNVSDATHGYIKINTIEIKNGTPGITENPYPWTGVYFSNIPVTLKAIANPGFTFSHWTGASEATDAEITINAADAFSVTAVFIPSVIEIAEPVYFWLADGAIPNDTPLQLWPSTFKASDGEAAIAYQSCLVGYPFTSSSPKWRKASMERRNSPTEINYIPEANDNIAYVPGIMKALQITQPFRDNGLENTMIFNLSTIGYKDLKFAFAAKNENAAEAIVIDYSTTAIPEWQTAGIISARPLSASYQLFETDFTAIAAANENAYFKVRLRFDGPDMTADNGDRVTFNNFSLTGIQVPLAVAGNNSQRFTVSPNPFSNFITISGTGGDAQYTVYTIEGRRIQSGYFVENAPISLEGLTHGMYLLQVVAEDRIETKKIIKK